MREGIWGSRLTFMMRLVGDGEEYKADWPHVAGWRVKSAAALDALTPLRNVIGHIEAFCSDQYPVYECGRVSTLSNP